MQFARRPMPILFGLVVIALILDALFFTGIYGSDDRSYAWAARHLANGELLYLRDLAHARLAINLPNALLYWLTDGNTASIIWAQTSYHLVLVVLAYILGTLFHQRSTGLCAAAIVAVNPMFYIFAGALLPDNATAAWLGLTMVFLELGRRHALDSIRRAGPHYMAAGLAIGMAYSCKETGLIMTVPAAVSVIVAAKGLRNWKWLRNGCIMAAGLGIFFVIELIVLRITGGQWMSRLALVSASGGEFKEYMKWQGSHPFDRIHYAIFVCLLPIIPLTTWILSIGSILYCFINKRAITLVAFFWWPLVFLTMGSTQMTRYLPPMMQTRYYAIVILPAAIMTAAVGVWLGGRMVRWFADWTYRPSRINSRYLAIALVAVASLVPLREYRVNLSSAGNLFSAAEARALIYAIEAAREKYPQYPIVLAEYYGYRMGPMFFPQAPNDIYMHDPRISPKAFPPPPFLFIRPFREVNTVAPVTGSSTETRTLDIVFPPRNRLSPLRNMWPRLVGLKPHRSYLRNRNGAAVLQLVEPSVELKTINSVIARESIVAPIQPLSPETEVYSTHDGRGNFDGHNIVSNQRKFSVQFFNLPAVVPSAIDRPVHRIELAITVTRLRGSGGNLSIRAFGYDAQRLATQDESMSALGATAVEMHLVLESQSPLLRFTLQIQVTADEPGRSVVHISNPVRIHDSPPNSSPPNSLPPNSSPPNSTPPNSTPPDSSSP